MDPGGGESLPQSSGNSGTFEQEGPQGTRSKPAASDEAGMIEDVREARKLEARIGYHLTKVSECENMANDLLKKAQRHKLLRQRLGRQRSEKLTLRLL